VDEAILDNHILLAEKEISLLTDIPDSLPGIKATPTMISRIIHRILKTVISISPPRSGISLIVLQQNENLHFRINHRLVTEHPSITEDSPQQEPTFPDEEIGFSEQEWYILTRQMAALQGQISLIEVSSQAETLDLLFQTVQSA
jgi:hypothetical protein